MQHVIKRCSAGGFFSRGEQSGHHGRRRLLNLLSDRTTSQRGYQLQIGPLTKLFNAPACVSSPIENVTITLVLKNSIKYSFKHGIASAAVVQSVTVGPRYGTGRFSLKSSVTDKLRFVYMFSKTVNLNIFFNTRRPSKWKVKMFSSQQHSHCR